ncbi:MAG TPA: DUF952 domain-containing protein [Anaerolinea sp.]|nr:DUF952 domain-containing protein [Anaerolinea sp.]
MAFIYHITPLRDWQAAQAAGTYTADSLEREGFIHCSTAEQVVDTANRYYAGQAGLALLRIRVEALRAEVRYENLVGGEMLFPHIYGPLNLDAVESAADFPPGADGRFSLPETGFS